MIGNIIREVTVVTGVCLVSLTLVIGQPAQRPRRSAVPALGVQPGPFVLRLMPRIGVL